MNFTNDIYQYLKRLKNGERCVEEFFRATCGYINFVAYHYLTDKSFVDDVVVNAFCKIIDNIDKFDESRSGRAWISKITQNEAHEINDREKKHRHISLDDVSREAVCTTDYFGRSEFAATLQRALDGFDEREREIVELRVLENMTFAEIGQKLNIRVGTVHKIFQRVAKQILGDII